MDYSLLAGVFLEGVLSFLSPCVLPLIPLYMSYLSGEDKEVDESGNIHYKTAKVFIATLFFVLGICLTFALLSISISSFKDFLNRYSEVISIIGGTLLIIFGLHECGLIHIDVLNKEFKLKVDLKLEKMSFFKAFVLGFIFSLGWSPCIGPMLANAIFLASTQSEGYLYIVAYGLGMVIPFLVTGLFTSSVLNFINRRKNIVNVAIKIAGIILICYGAYMIYNGAKQIGNIKKIEELSHDAIENNTSQNNNEQFDVASYLLDYELKTIDSQTVKLSDYKGKYVFLNFTTTWCQYCDMELPEYEKFAENEEIECLIIMSPLNENNGMADIEKHLKEKNVKLTTLIDEEGLFFYYCGISGYPTTYVVDPDGNFVVYTSGALNLQGFTSLYEYAKQNH